MLFFAASTARAERIRVPRDQPTLQAAVDAADDGDEIVVSRNQTGPVEIHGKAGVTIRSSGRRSIGDVDIVNSSRIRLQGFVVKGSGGAAVYMMNANDVSLVRCTVLDAPTDGIRVDRGQGLLVSNCRVERIGAHGIAIGGGGTFGAAIGPRLVANRFRKVVGAAVGIFDGVDAVVERNRISKSDLAIYVGPFSETSGTSSARISVRGNRISGCRMGVAVISCSNVEVERNRCTDVTEVAFAIGGDEDVPGSGAWNRLADNVSTRAEIGFLIGSDDNVAEGNTSWRSSGSGYFVVGMYTERNVLRENASFGAGEHGFCVTGREHVLEGNVSKGANGCGFYVDAEACTITDNRARRSGEYDLSDWRGTSTYSGNDFPHVAP
jgi:nitrous oxidase accessory protein NosD